MEDMFKDLFDKMKPALIDWACDLIMGAVEKTDNPIDDALAKPICDYLRSLKED